MVTIGVDLGGANVSAVVLDGEESVGYAKLRTPGVGARTDVIEVIVAAALEALKKAGRKRKDVVAIGLGSPGVVIDGTVGGASNVPGFVERFPLAESVRNRIDVPVRVVNDVTAAAVGEHRLGAGRGSDDVLAVFVGTGVGGGLVLGGRPYEGAHGGAGEIGHVVVRKGGAVCPCGRRGCVEAYAGRRAMTLAAARARDNGTATVLFDVAKKVKGEKVVTSSAFKEALDRGDTLVADLLDDAIDALGVGIASAVNLLDVGVVVLGGGLADKLGERFRDRVDAAMRPHLFLQPPRVRLVAAELGDEGGAVGAAILARELG